MMLKLILASGIIACIGFLMWKQSNSLSWLTNSKPLKCRKEQHRHDCMLCSQIKKCLRHLDRQARFLLQNPELSGEILQRLQYLMPTGIIFREQRVRVNRLAKHIHKRHDIHRNPAALKLHTRINSQVGHLHRKAAEQEKRISSLHQLAKSYTVVGHHKKLRDCVKAAVKIQRFNHKLLKNLNRTEKWLCTLIKI